MIDTKARAGLVVALASLVEGRMTNDEFADRYAEDWAESTDRAVAGIAEYGDSLYTDAMTYRLEGAHAVSEETRKVADRCILFLKAGLEYDWPDAPATALQSVAGGFTMFLLLPFGIVLLIAAALVRTASLLVAGLAVLGLCLFLWRWSRDEDTPEWREYWSHGDREVWPFLRGPDYEQAVMDTQEPTFPDEKGPDHNLG
jgi:hypothetical protein